MTYSYPKFEDIDALKRFVTRHGNPHYFSADTMRFFRSRVSESLYGGRFFVTSERDALGNYPRLYTVRFVRDNGDGSVSVTSTGFERYSSRSGAHRHAERLAKNVDAGTDPIEFDNDRDYL